MSGNGWEDPWAVPIMAVALVLSPLMYAWRALKRVVARVWEPRQH